MPRNPLRKFHDKEAIQLVRHNGLALESLSKQHQNKESIVLAAVQQNGKALQFASSRLRHTKAIVLAAVSQNGEALNFTGRTLKDNWEIASKAVQQNPEALKFASLSFQLQYLKVPTPPILSFLTLSATSAFSLILGLLMIARRVNEPTPHFGIALTALSGLSFRFFC